VPCLAIAKGLTLHRDWGAGFVVLLSCITPAGEVPAVEEIAPLRQVVSEGGGGENEGAEERFHDSGGD